jgi:hypothetical protein
MLGAQNVRGGTAFPERAYTLHPTHPTPYTLRPQHYTLNPSRHVQGVTGSRWRPPMVSMRDSSTTHSEQLLHGNVQRFRGGLVLRIIDVSITQR